MTAAFRPDPEPGPPAHPGPSPRRGRRPGGWTVWTARLLVLPLVGLAIPLLVFEVALRAFGPVLPGEYQLGALMAPHERYGHFHLADASAWYRTDEYTAHVRTNGLGLRGPDVSAQRTPGRGRILVSGDSFVEARQVSESDTTVALLGSLLGGAPSEAPRSSVAGHTCEVVNAGVAGWGTGEEYVYLREEGLALRPDLVLLVVFLGNDVSNNARRAEVDSNWHAGPGFRLERDGRLTELGFRFMPEESTLSLLLGRLSFTSTFLESGVLAKLEDADEDESRSGILKRDLFSARESAQVRRAWELTEALVGGIAREVEQAGSSLLLVAAPASYQVYQEEARWLRAEARSARTVGGSGVDAALTAPNRRLEAMAKQLDVRLLDLLPVLRVAAAQNPHGRLYFERDAHWTAAGHRVVAHEIARFFGDHPDLLPDGCTSPERPAARLAMMT